MSASFEYDSFGREVRATGATVPASPNTPPGLVAGASFADALPFHFSTKFTDQESGLNYYGYRFYDPLDGRWLNRDPIGTRGGLNLYAMLDNNPLSYIDLLGLEKRDCNWAIYHSHGTQKRDDPDNNTQKAINESSPQKCDKLGFSGCHRKSMNQFIEDKHPGKVLPSAERQNDQETLVNGKKPFEDNRNPGDKLPQDGLELIKLLEKTKIDAKTEIAKPESCCKSITIHIVCPSPDFQKWYSKEKVGEDGPYCGKTYTIK